MRTWRRGNTHYVGKTRKDHKCYCCGKIIPKGSLDVEYKNEFTGKRAYWHTVCPKKEKK